MSLSRLIARPMMSSIFVVGPVKTWKAADAVAPSVENVTGAISRSARKAGIPAPTDGATYVRINAAIQVTAGLALATGRYPRVAAAVLAGTLIPTTLGGHSFWQEQDPGSKSQQQLQFAKNLSLLGGLIIAAGDTDGRPGLAWRARRAAKDARREARTIAKAARNEAKLAKAKVA